MRIAGVVVTMLVAAGVARAQAPATDPAAIAQEAWRLEQGGRYRDAIARFDDAIRVAPRFSNAYNGRGLARANLEDYAGALSDYATALELDPGNGWALANRGILETYLGKDADAKRDLDAAAGKLGAGDRAQLQGMIKQVTAMRPRAAAPAPKSVASKVEPPPPGKTAQEYFDGGAALYRQNKMSSAFAWFLESAKLGNARAQLQVGWHYDAGAGGAKNKQLALTWWAMAASQGDEIAAANLGNVYMGDQGIAKDLPRARRWYERAARKGNAAAKQQLARMAPSPRAGGGGAAWMSSLVDGPVPSSNASNGDDEWWKKYEKDKDEQARKDADQDEKDRQDKSRKDWEQGEEDQRTYYEDREAEKRAAEAREQANYAQQEAENRAAEAREAAERAQQQAEEARQREEEEARARNNGE